MPAIQPARLKQQAALLAGHFEDPPAFVRSLHYLLDFYADRAHRPGQSGEPPPLLASYRVRPPVLRQLILELAPWVQENPQAGLALCDALWGQPTLEFRQLAAALLGQVPPSPPERVMQRVEAWLGKDTEERLRVAVLHQGLARLRRENPRALLAQVEAWLGGDTFACQNALRALLPLVEDSNFQNLPVFYRLVQPLSRAAPAPLRAEVLDILAALAHRSPQETAYFLRQSLKLPNSPDTPWLIRQTLNEFPPDLQEALRTAVRGLEWQPGKKQ